MYSVLESKQFIVVETLLSLPLDSLLILKGTSFSLYNLSFFLSVVLLELTLK